MTRWLFTWIIFWSATFLLSAQVYERLTGILAHGTNAINFFSNTGYSGVAMVDLNGDGYEDILYAPNRILMNDQNGNFSLRQDVVFPNGYNHRNGSGGFSVADFDNDGLNDVCVAGYPTRLYRNIGDGQFEEVREGFFDRQDSVASWACAFAEVNNDGMVDLVLIHPANFIIGAAAAPNFLLLNQDGIFTADTTYGFTRGLAPYTVGTFGDYDDDGDQDFFIGSGPAGTLGLDSIYQNVWNETNGAQIFQPLKGQPFTDSLQNGQIYNFIDIDNDRDLDIYLTNYAGISSRLYINQAGTYIAEDRGISLSGASLNNVWGDIDLDGDLDVIINNDGLGASDVYYNDGSGHFTKDPCELASAPLFRTAALADTDQDGDLDLFMGGLLALSFYRNTVIDQNWIQFNLEGTRSNRSAIGAKIFALATINGTSYWQRRDISAQNAFQGQNSLRVHFGLGQASQIDSLHIVWPSGDTSRLGSFIANSIYDIKEEEIEGIQTPVWRSGIIQIQPNPAAHRISIKTSLEHPAIGSMGLFDMHGRQLQSLLTQERLYPQWTSEIDVSQIPNGTYLIKLHTTNWSSVEKIIIQK